MRRMIAWLGSALLCHEALGKGAAVRRSEESGGGRTGVKES